MNEKNMKEYYDDMLNEVFPKTNISGIDYPYSYLLKEIDPIAYEVGMSDYESVLREAHEEDGSYADLFGDEEE
jgi:hypothetical protein